MNPIVSIVIPSFNSSGYIVETLESIARQTSPSCEVVIIDDRSTDNSAEVAEKALKSLGLPGRVIVRPEDISKGVSSCRNLGIRSSTADWVFFLDSDDLLMPETMKVLTAKIANYGNSCFAYFHSVRSFEDGTNATLEVKILEYGAEPVDILPQLAITNFITTSSVTIKKSLLNEIGGFDNTLHGIEDYMMWMRVSKRTKWCYSKEILTEYRVRTASLMGGRRFVYYITQNSNLRKSMCSLSEFTSDDIKKLDVYINDVTRYYALVSLNVWGWGDFLKGTIALIQSGRAGLAFSLLGQHSKNLLLKKAVSVVRGKKK